ncbi:MAG: DUF4349 domain-containing protein [Oscillochloris sp.]|nr:DUF4349 domain-containing protein [Oscillochloris sp.]
MSFITKLSGQARSLIGFSLIAVIAFTFLVSTMLGGRVSQVFSQINSGLSTNGGYTLDTRQESASGAAEAAALPPSAAEAPQPRMVIQNATLQIEVTDVTQADAGIRALVDTVGGYIVNSSINGEGNDLSISLSTKVPAGQFDQTMSAIQALASKVRLRTISGQDVTEEFVDLKARLHNLEITRDRVEGFLEQATKIDEMLQINTTLNDLQGQIEQLQGRMQYLSQNTAVSTIDVNIQPIPVVPIVNEEGWQPITVARGALHDVILTGQGLINMIIVILIWTPLLTPPLVLGWWIWRRFLRGRQDDAPHTV